MYNNLVYSLRSNILIESYSATTELLRKDLSQGTNLAILGDPGAASWVMRKSRRSSLQVVNLTASTFS